MTNSSATNSQKSILTLEEKLLRLQEIHKLFEERKVTLSQSIPLLEEAYNLKKEIEEELEKIETKLISLTGRKVNNMQGDF
jgi:exonuclease VII small subunit